RFPYLLRVRGESARVIKPVAGPRPPNLIIARHSPAVGPDHVQRARVRLLIMVHILTRRESSAIRLRIPRVGVKVIDVQHCPRTGVEATQIGHRAGQSHGLPTTSIEVFRLDQELTRSPYRSADCE